MSTRESIRKALDEAMTRCEGLPGHVYVQLPRRVSPEFLRRAAEAEGAWVREYHPRDTEQEVPTAIIACR